MADKNENTPMPKMGEKPGVSAAVTSSGMSQEEFDTVSEIREKFKDATAVQIAILAAAKNNPAQSTEGTPPAQSTEGTPPNFKILSITKLFVKRFVQILPK
mgnify:CR=1 FL=1